MKIKITTIFIIKRRLKLQLKMFIVKRICVFLTIRKLEVFYSMSRWNFTAKIIFAPSKHF